MSEAGEAEKERGACWAAWNIGVGTDSVGCAMAGLSGEAGRTAGGTGKGDSTNGGAWGVAVGQDDGGGGSALASARVCEAGGGGGVGVGSLLGAREHRTRGISRPGSKPAFEKKAKVHLQPGA